MFTSPIVALSNLKSAPVEKSFVNLVRTESKLEKGKIEIREERRKEVASIHKCASVFHIFMSSQNHLSKADFASESRLLAAAELYQTSNIGGDVQQRIACVGR